VGECLLLAMLMMILITLYDDDMLQNGFTEVTRYEVVTEMV